MKDGDFRRPFCAVWTTLLKGPESGPKRLRTRAVRAGYVMAARYQVMA